MNAQKLHGKSTTQDCGGNTPGLERDANEALFVGSRADDFVRAPFARSWDERGRAKIFRAGDRTSPCEGAALKVAVAVLQSVTG